MHRDPALDESHATQRDLTPDMNSPLPLDALLAECDREPIQFPGAVQPHGAMLAVEAAGLHVTHASANLAAFIDREAREALGQPLAAVFGDEVTALLAAAARARRANPSAAGIDAGIVDRVNAPSEVAAGGQVGPPGARLRLLPFISTGGAICIDLLREPAPDPAEAALIQAQRVIQALRLSRTSAGLCRIAVNDLRRVTGFDRVLVYRFDDDGSGDVIAEDHPTGAVGFLGLKYPASDIPQQARRLYLVQRLRVIPDVNAEPVALIAVRGSRATDLDLSASWVRAVSPIHLQYLRHMAVSATAVVSLVVAGRLWGMLVCHHNSPRQVSADQRALLDLVGQVVSVMLGSLTDSEHIAQRTQRQRALDAISMALAKPDDSIGDAFAASASDLVNLVPAHGAVVTVGERAIAVGHTPEPVAFRTIIAALTALSSNDLSASAELHDVVPDAAASLDGFAGALLLPLPNCAGGSIAWFRRELNLTVNWAGDPGKRAPDPLTGRLEPRLSFAAWKQQVHGRSAPWSEADLGAARELRRVVDEALVRRNEVGMMLRLRDNDPLTGLLNRRAAESHLKAIAGIPLKPPTTVVILNVDRFRKVNELLGNPAGDALLVQIAHRLQVAVAPGEQVARLGADEFGVLSDKGGAGGAELARRVLAIFNQPFEIAKQLLQMHASVGVADSVLAGTDVAGLLRSAQTATRQAKSAGGNRIAHFVQDLGDEASRQLIIEQGLEVALRAHREQFQLAFQPIIDVASGGLRSWEVLVRWQHPSLGIVSPGEFIPIAESCGLIAGIGDLVLEESFRHLVDLPPSADPGERDVYVSVNVSPMQLTRAGFASHLAALLDGRGIAPARLCIEVTEGVFTNQDAVSVIGAIRALGVLVAVDDFGIGYSSLSTLQRLPADVVKLDRSFVPDLDAALPSDRSFLGAVVALAHTVGLTVVIEGVESQLQLDAVVAAGVDAIQGFFLGRPMTGEAAMALTCQSNDERSWKTKIDAARRFAAGGRLVSDGESLLR